MESEFWEAKDKQDKTDKLERESTAGYMSGWIMMEGERGESEEKRREESEVR